jgi:hypothetical protein
MQDWFILGWEGRVKGSGVSPAEAGLFPRSMSEETAEKEGTGSHGQRRQGLGGSEGRGGHLLPPPEKDGTRVARWRVFSRPNHHGCGAVLGG